MVKSQMICSGYCRNFLVKVHEPNSVTYLNLTPVVSGVIRCHSKIGHYLSMCSKEILDYMLKTRS